MKENTLIIYPKGTFGDKNNNVQLYKSSTENHTNLKAIVISINQYNIHPHFKSLNLFIQGDQCEWTMIESWSDDFDLFIEFCEFLSLELKLYIELI